VDDTALDKELAGPSLKRTSMLKCSMSAVLLTEGMGGRIGGSGGTSIGVVSCSRWRLIERVGICSSRSSNSKPGTSGDCGTNRSRAPVSLARNPCTKSESSAGELCIVAREGLSVSKKTSVSGLAGRVSMKAVEDIDSLG